MDRPYSHVAALTAFALQLCAGCTGTILDGGPQCGAQVSATAAVPQLLSPGPEERVVVPSSLAIATRYTGNAAHKATEIEIWLTAGSELVEKVWSLQTTEPAILTHAGLVDGAFETGFDGLSPWTSYAIRVRHSESDLCQWSEWSEPRRFLTDDGSDYFFSNSEIPELHIELSDESMSAINAEALPPDCVPHSRSYQPGTVRFEDQVFEGAGVRAKGGCGSARDLNGKTGFKINLSWDDPNRPGCPQTRRLHGLKRLTLNNQVQDRSFVHERLAYHLYGLLGLPTLRAAPIRVFVNGSDYGLYLNLESFDRRMLRRNFDSARGMLYEGEYGCDVTPDWVPADESENCWEKEFSADDCSTPEPGDDPTTFELLRELSNQIAAMPQGAFYPEIEDFVAFDDFLSTWAADTIIGHWDSYIYAVPNNYRIYHDPSTGLWTLLSGGVDQTFAPAPNETLEVNPWQVSAVFARRCLEESECEAAFAARLHEAIEIFESANLGAMARHIESEIGAEVESDPRKEGSNEDFRRGVADVVDFVRRRPAEVRAMLAERGY